MQRIICLLEYGISFEYFLIRNLGEKIISKIYQLAVIDGNEAMTDT